ncbi:Putative peptidoglycan binding domain-containing protein [Streptomyces sp. yr375]|uniref:peptidoglycan-binding domain-containing protein n=1 Tax=Streptomyces sp. yr375 TaxID=1761906 RepID=UPI0008C42AEC|nr:peptidoglycan-binding domain-containing protein [Streptomyces sp. yr375]SEP75696.1 Putative peptidoglycan binding domain-containing protein [Streptomyces sp. yr375]
MPTRDESGQPHDRAVVEPIRVLRPRNTDALAELFREMTELTQDTDSYEAISLPVERAVDEAPTEEFPPVGQGTPATLLPRDDRDWASERPRPAAMPGPATSGSPSRAANKPVGRPKNRPTGTPTNRPASRADARSAARADSGAGRRRAAITIGVCAAALVGFACALLLPGRGGEASAETPAPTATQAATPTAAPTAAAPTAAAPADPDGTGTLREGDSGPEVLDLQKRLLRIPDVYAKGPTDGRYDTVLTAAVARFQLWYGIRGDESGVYGNDTRRDLESRTGAGDD